MDVGVSDGGWLEVEGERRRGGVGIHKYYRSDAQVEPLLRGRSWWDGRWSGRGEGTAVRRRGLRPRLFHIINGMI